MAAPGFWSSGPLPIGSGGPTPAARARSSMASRSASKSEPSTCACESVRFMAAVAKPQSVLLELRSHRYVFQKSGKHRRTIRQGGRDDHAIRFDTTQFSRLQIRHYHYFAPHELLGLVCQGQASDYLSHL